MALDEPIIELESDKATVEVPAPAAGVVTEIVAEVGAVLKVGDLLARDRGRRRAARRGEAGAGGARRRESPRRPPPASSASCPPPSA